MPAAPKSKRVKRKGHRKGQRNGQRKVQRKIEGKVEGKNEDTDRSDYAASTPILRLPTELVQIISNLVFDTTVLTWKHFSSHRGKWVKPHTLALLHVCRKIRSDIGTTWLRRVLFYFESPYAILRVLEPKEIQRPYQKKHPALSPETVVSQIRRIRVYRWYSEKDTSRFEQSPYATIFYDRRSEMSLSDAFLSLNCTFSWCKPQSLKLDVLMVEGGPYADKTCECIDELLRYSVGWKELHVFTENKKFPLLRQGPLAQLDLGTHIPNAHRWNKTLLKRDGVNSGSSVATYRMRDSSNRAKPERPYRCSWPRDDELVKQEVPEQEGNGKTDWRGPFVVVAKRGRKVKIQGRVRAIQGPFGPILKMLR